MELCLCCREIKKIRKKQGKKYLKDLCQDCKRKVISNSQLVVC